MLNIIRKKLMKHSPPFTMYTIAGTFSSLALPLGAWVCMGKCLILIPIDTILRVSSLQSNIYYISATIYNP